MKRSASFALVACALLTACTRQTSSEVASAAGATQGTISTQSADSLPDTAFVETGRFINQGVRTAHGCRFTGHAKGKPGLIYEARPISGDWSTCTVLEAEGYRRKMPAEDSTGYASASASVDLDSAALAALRRKH